MIKIALDGIAIEVKEGTTVFKAAQQAGLHIPHLCYHPAFAPEGSCRLCLVEIEGMPKLELACSTVVREGMNIATQSLRVRESRRAVLEFLLAEHPLDCPICDKAGECKLQDYYQDYGLTEGLFNEFKEKREKKVRLGEKLLLDRERCVLCTRCVRFLAEITQTGELGVFERSLHAEISTYEGQLVRNNYAGNLVDLCPVGAITDTEFRFKTRTWFLNKAESICPLCSRGCNIFVDYHPGFPRVSGSARIYRVRPRANEAVNGHWICDYGRYGYVEMLTDRSQQPIWNKGDKKAVLSWGKALLLLAEKIKGLKESRKIGRMALVLNSGLTNEELFLIKKIFKDDLGATKIFFADPKPGTGDGNLLQAERTSNRRGAQEIGYELKAADLNMFIQNTGILVIFGPYLAESFSFGDLKTALDKIETKVLITSHTCSLEEFVDFVLPAAIPPEKRGSFTNSDGGIQKFSAVYPPCGDVKPEEIFLLDLARELGIGDGYYGRLADSDKIFRELEKEIPFFRARS